MKQRIVVFGETRESAIRFFKNYLTPVYDILDIGIEVEKEDELETKWTKAIAYKFTENCRAIKCDRIYYEKSLVNRDGFIQVCRPMIRENFKDNFLPYDLTNESNNKGE